MQLSYINTYQPPFIEGSPDQPFLTTTNDIDRLIEACFSDRVSIALLYAINMTPAFFDLSSGEAGTILQKLRNYHIRLAVVCPPGSVRLSSRFPELIADEQRGTDFGLFPDRQAAVAWIGR